MPLRNQGLEMTVGELIDRLREFPPGVMVVVSGYEFGYDPVTPLSIHPIRLMPGYGETSYGGKFMEYEGEEAKKGEPIEAVVIPR